MQKKKTEQVTPELQLTVVSLFLLLFVCLNKSKGGRLGLVEGGGEIVTTHGLGVAHGGAARLILGQHEGETCGALQALLAYCLMLILDVA